MRHGLSVRRLAASANLDVEDVQILLLEAGIDVGSPATKLSPAELRRAKAALADARAAATAAPDPVPTSLQHRGVEWPTVDEEPVDYLDLKSVMAVHDALVREFRGTDDSVDPPGVRDSSFLEAALFRPKTEGHGVRKYPTVQLAGAALLHSLVLNHPFFNGNKRTALVAFVWFLRLNHHMILFTEDELYDLVLRVGDHDLVETQPGARPSADAEVLAIYAWLRPRSRRPEHGDKLIIWHRLERILRSFGCTFDTPRRNRRNIYRDGRRCQVMYARKGMDVMATSVKKIREDLELDDEHGIDSAIFYGAATPARKPEDIIAKYRRVLVELAKYDRGEVLDTAG